MSDSKLLSLKQSGQILSNLKKTLRQALKPGTTPLAIEKLANQFINKSNAQASFKQVPNYQYATCININSGMVHGIPTDIPFKPRDVVTIDCGIYYQGYHTDSAFTIQLKPQDKSTTRFLQAGSQALNQAIKQAKPGRSVYDIGLAIQQTIKEAGYSVTKDLTGHGIGKKLHQLPNIPCFANSPDQNIILKSGQALAIEVMYAQYDPQLEQASDGWTLSTIDNSLTAMFEETIYLTSKGNLVLT